MPQRADKQMGGVYIKSGIWEQLENQNVQTNRQRWSQRLN